MLLSFSYNWLNNKILLIIYSVIIKTKKMLHRMVKTTIWFSY
jgi:hypothetical protein